MTTTMPPLGTSNFSAAITLTEGGPAATPACGSPNGDSATTSIKTLTISEPLFNLVARLSRRDFAAHMKSNKIWFCHNFFMSLMLALQSLS
jgi:hypothetical protein